MSEVETRVCKRCGIEKRLACFAPLQGGRYRRHSCNTCNSGQYKSSDSLVSLATWRRANPSWRQEQYRRHAKRNQAMVDAKRAAPCVDCGTGDLPVELMHLDHVRGPRLQSMLKFVQRGTAAAMERELAKCDVRCPTCHYLRHYQDETASSRSERTSWSAKGLALVESKRSEPCADCGRADLPLWVMHLDHVRGEPYRCPGGAKYTIASMAVVSVPTKLVVELAKCDTRCPNCHALRHLQRHW